MKYQKYQIIFVSLLAQQMACVSGQAYAPSDENENGSPADNLQEFMLNNSIKRLESDVRSYSVKNEKFAKSEDKKLIEKLLNKARNGDDFGERNYYYSKANELFRKYKEDNGGLGSGNGRPNEGGGGSGHSREEVELNNCIKRLESEVRSYSVRNEKFSKSEDKKLIEELLNKAQNDSNFEEKYYNYNKAKKLFENCKKGNDGCGCGSGGSGCSEEGAKVMLNNCLKRLESEMRSYSAKNEKFAKSEGKKLIEKHLDKARNGVEFGERYDNYSKAKELFENCKKGNGGCGSGGSGCRDEEVIVMLNNCIKRLESEVRSYSVKNEKFSKIEDKKLIEKLLDKAQNGGGFEERYDNYNKAKELFENCKNGNSGCGSGGSGCSDEEVLLYNCLKRLESEVRSYSGKNEKFSKSEDKKLIEELLNKAQNDSNFEEKYYNYNKAKKLFENCKKGNDGCGCGSGGSGCSEEGAKVMLNNCLKRLESEMRSYSAKNEKFAKSEGKKLIEKHLDKARNGVEFGERYDNYSKAKELFENCKKGNGGCGSGGSGCRDEEVIVMLNNCIKRLESEVRSYSAKNKKFSKSEGKKLIEKHLDNARKGGDFGERYYNYNKARELFENCKKGNGSYGGGNGECTRATSGRC